MTPSVPEGSRVAPLPPRPEELLLVALGAVPGALLRWLLQADPLANGLGCLVIGIVSGSEPPRRRAMLLVGIGFCGSLTTFSGWILALERALGLGSVSGVALLLLELVAGVLAVLLGRGLAGRLARCRPRLRR
ncbi:FluC/FEX family fluoride channel [Vulcanococcus limneticus]|uniref:FluC/FEX family fluoride channel n=1 Tax=Vulcanococcus limneticus TaxID=2170428 RepID=UPI00398BC0C9